MSDFKIKVIYCSIHRPDFYPILKEHLKDYTFVWKPLEEFLDAAKNDENFIEKMKREADVFIGDPKSIIGILDWKESNLKFVQSVFLGIDNVLDHCHENQIKKLPFKLSKYQESSVSIQMAEFVICHTLNWMRRTFEMRQSQLKNCWNHQLVYTKFCDITVCIFGGTGSVGSIIAKYCKTMGADVWTVGFKQRSDEELKDYPYKYRSYNETQECLENCDVICSVLPKTDITNGFFNPNTLKFCKKKPLFINIGRGNSISEDDVIESLNAGYISRAVLDVFLEEPLDKTSKLWQTPEVFITMHAAGSVNPKEVVPYILENFRRLTNNEELMHEIDINCAY